MNGWYEAASAAAHDAMDGYRRRARLDAQLRQARAAHAGARPGRLRRAAAATLRRLADALAPQPGDALA